ncbi:DeoR/GlpR family DNA-binding transcription regulator [Lacisediminihabitans sp.]|jgi:DeoR family transcriptional regulator of aga operon|uniref:DeoR/GlpR family DNA-binding transcription regulator n=1 Tax=Lacisediminihabitans sp. TaxID=2787631 RepID=UPI002F95190E
MTDAQHTPPAAARRVQIRTLIEERGFARVAQLSRQFGISEVTVRADLDALADDNVVQRVHGGAVVGTPARPAGLERPFEQSMLASSDEKARIGRAAAALIESDQAVVLDVGTTTTAIAAAMLERDDLQNVVVITNALNIALALEPAIPRFTVVVTGGTLRPLQHSLVDPLAGVVLDRIRADIAFIGCSGVHVTAGITNVNLPEADVKRRMIATAARTVVVADSSKLGVAQLSRVAPLAEIDTLITGGEADAAVVETLRDAGLRVIQVDHGPR